MTGATEISGRSAWLGSDLAKDRSWIQVFTPAELAELHAALLGVVARKIKLEEIGREDFPLPTLAPKLLGHLQELQLGRGFVVLRGLPVRQYSDDEAAIIYWGIGTHLGTAVKQNTAGDLLGHVRDFGKKWGELGVRGYETNGQLIFHTDFSDLVGLLCLRRSKTGGASRIASSITVHNELLGSHPDCLAPLYRGYRYIKREAVEFGQPRYQLCSGLRAAGWISKLPLRA